jgi:hypothetical protein
LAHRIASGRERRREALGAHNAKLIPKGLIGTMAWIFAALGASYAVPETKNVGTDEQ